MKTTASAKGLGPKALEKLVAEIGTLIASLTKTGNQVMNEQELETYWRIGRRLSRLAAESEVVVRHVAKAVGVQEMLLYRTRRFFHNWPDGLTSEAKRLSWSKHLVFAGLKSRAERDFYVKTALAKGWDRDSLRSAVTRDYYGTLKSADLAVENVARYEDPMHVYKAIVQEVIDGDTFIALVDLGFHSWTKQRFRLRGVNAAELARPNRPSADAARAVRAKAFVEEKFQGVKFIVVKTHKTNRTDVYGRFLADVYYHPDFEDDADVATKGFCLKDELLKAGLAVPSFV